MTGIQFQENQQTALRNSVACVVPSVLLLIAQDTATKEWGPVLA